jgi:phosphoglycolate phosphatase
MSVSTPRSCRLIIFDLDGTLIDSKLDIANSVNIALLGSGLPAIDISRIVEFVGDGMQKLIQRSLRESTGSQPNEEQIARTVGLYKTAYEQHLLDSTKLYPGVREALDQLSWARFAVVTNKPEGFSRTILAAFGVLDRFCSIIGGDSSAGRKPNPDPLRRAMSGCRVPAEESVMVGDSPTDIFAGKAAGAITCGITGGYRSAQALRDAGCDLILSSVSELPNCLIPAEPEEANAG